MAEIEGSELVAQALQQQGADLVFTVVGGPVIEAVGACGRLGLRPIGVHHEQAAVMMAQAAAYSGGEGRAGVALLASGPAVTNGLTGVHVAWDNCWPVVVLGGSSSRAQQGLMPFQEADSVTLMRPITKWAVQVDRAARIPEVIALAFQKAISGRPGPVYVDLPADVLQEVVDDAQVRRGRAPVEPAPPAGDARTIEVAAQLLRDAERPLLLTGKGLRWSSLSPEALAGFVDHLGLPFVPSPMGRGFIPDDHPLCMSAARSMALREADVVLVLGARLNWVFGLGRTLSPDANIIQVDIEPSEIGLQRAVAAGIHADAGAAVTQIMGAIGQRDLEGLAARRAESPWQDALRRARSQNEAALAPLLESDAVPMNHHRTLKEIRDLLPRDSVISVDGQVVLASARQVLPSYLPAARLNSGSNGCMGVGIPFAIGAKLARPERPVISINGDCAFGFNGMEMETSLRYNAPVVFVVDNNQGIMGGILEGRMFPDGYGERVAMYQPGVRYDRIIEAMGGHGEHVERPDELRPALERAFASGRSACIDVTVDPAAIWPIPTAGRASSLMGY